MSYQPRVRHEDFGSAENLGADLNDAFVVDNLHGLSTAAFQIAVPAGGTVAFEGTFDTAWIPVSFRSIENDEFQQSTNESGSFIGSISGVRKFRFRTSAAGSAAGSVIGRAVAQVSMLEGQEFFPPPDAIGQTPLHKDAQFTTQQTGVAIWTPASGRRIVVTDMFVSATGTTDAEARIFDETDEPGKRLFLATLDPSAQNSIYIPINLRVPFVSSAKDNVIKLTTTAAVKISVNLHGYEKL